MQPTTTDKKTTINERLFFMLKQVMGGESGENPLIPATYHPVILNLVKPFLKKTPESDLRAQIEKLRDEIIPFILGE